MSRIKQQEYFGAAVRAIRSRMRLNQADFAALISCNQNTISRYESGKVFPSTEALTAVWKLADAIEKHLLRAYLSELFSFVGKAEQDQFLDSMIAKRVSAGLPNPAVLARFELLFEQYMTDPDATRLFTKAANWLETEFKMRAADRRKANEDQTTEAPPSEPGDDAEQDGLAEGSPVHAKRKRP